MKKIQKLSLLTLFLVLSISLSAQNATKEQKKKVSNYMKEYEQTLSLTKEQSQAIQILVENQVVLIDKQKGLTPEDNEWLTLNQEIFSLKEQIDSLLTEEQKSKQWQNTHKKFVNKKTGKNLVKEYNTVKNDSIN